MSRLRTRLLRLKRIETLLLRAGDDGLRVAEIVSLTGADRRTIYRDIEFMSGELCVPIYEGDTARYCIDRSRYVSVFPGPSVCPAAKTGV